MGSLHNFFKYSGGFFHPDVFFFFMNNLWPPTKDEINFELNCLRGDKKCWLNSKRSLMVIWWRTFQECGKLILMSFSLGNRTKKSEMNKGRLLRRIGVKLQWIRFHLSIFVTFPSSSSLTTALVRFITLHAKLLSQKRKETKEKLYGSRDNELLLSVKYYVGHIEPSCFSG